MDASAKPPRKTPGQLRSACCFAPDDLRSFGQRLRTMQPGDGPEDWAGKPVIANIRPSRSTHLVQGCDFDHLETSFGAQVPEPDNH